VELAVDLEKVTAVVVDPEDVETVKVRIAAPADASPCSEATVHRLADVLVAARVGELDPDSTTTAWVRPDAVRFHAAGQVGEDWDERFEAVCSAGQARTGRAALEAVVVWPEPVRGPRG
jgi:hypothetical protein